MKSPTFNSLGYEWRMALYPGGTTRANQGYTSLELENCSKTEILIRFKFVIKNNSGRGGNIRKSKAQCAFEPQTVRVCCNFAPRATVMDTNFLQHGTSIVQVLFKVEHDLLFLYS